MIDFKEITLEDREWVRERLAAEKNSSSDYSFANLFIWRQVSKTRVADVNGFFCAIGNTFINEEICMYPTGRGDVCSVVEKLLEDANERGITLRIRGATKEQADLLCGLFPDKFEVENRRTEWDYLYLVEDLSRLAGKKYHGKRNHIKRFMDEEWAYEAITEQNLPECTAMNDAWCKKYGCMNNEDSSISMEQCAVHEAIRHFSALQLEGGLLRRHGEVVAFTIGEPLNDEVYIVHIEKAFSEIQGAYPMINQQFVLHNMQNYRYVNREDDVGDEGLRKAKMSYHPHMMLEKYTLTWK
jgi:hypothetical protein